MTMNVTGNGAVAASAVAQEAVVLPQPTPVQGPQAVQEVRYHCPIQPSVRRWNGEVVVFHPASSNTYLLDEFAMVIIERLEVRASTFTQLREFISRSYELDDEANLDSALKQKLLELMRLDFVEIQRRCG